MYINTIYRINAVVPITLNNQLLNYQFNVALKIVVYIDTV